MAGHRIATTIASVINTWSATRTLLLGVLAVGVAFPLVVIPSLAVSASAVHRTTVRSPATAKAATGCLDEKPGVPQGCWTEPSSYVAAPKTGSFTPISVPPASPSTNIPAGTINTMMMGPFSADQYLTQNAWWDQTGGVFYDVYAGALGSDPSQGVVVVFSGTSVDPTQADTDSLVSFPTSGHDGSLRITSTNGWTLTLEAGNGTTYVFDVATEQYL